MRISLVHTDKISLGVRECEFLGVKQIQGVACHPQSNSYVERLHGTVFRSLSHWISQAGDNWVEYLPILKASYNATPVAILGGRSPHFLQFGAQDFKLPFEG